MTGLFGARWIDTNSALKYLKTNNTGPNTLHGLIIAGKKCKFIRKTKDGFHWEVDSVLLKRYCEISNKPTLEEIATKLKTSAGSVKYHLMKNNIPFHEEMGRKYLKESDAEKLMVLWKANH